MAKARIRPTNGAYLLSWKPKTPSGVKKAFWYAIRRAFADARYRALEGTDFALRVEQDNITMRLQWPSDCAVAVAVPWEDGSCGSLIEDPLTDTLHIQVSNPAQRDALYATVRKFDRLRISAGRTEVAERVRCPDRGHGRSMTIRKTD